MNLRFLGDALDHWKGSLLEELQGENLLEDLLVDAMASDASDWVDDDWRLYCYLLRIRQEQLVRHSKQLSATRPGYFEEVKPSHDLFLDPDTGLATGPVRNPSQYIKPSELVALLRTDASRVVAVYQHGSRSCSQIRDRLGEVTARVREVEKHFAAGSYQSGTVAMLFFSLKAERVRSITAHFHSMLGRHADSRVGIWLPPAG